MSIGALLGVNVDELKVKGGETVHFTLNSQLRQCYREYILATICRLFFTVYYRTIHTSAFPEIWR